MNGLILNAIKMNNKKELKLLMKSITKENFSFKQFSYFLELALLDDNRKIVKILLQKFDQLIKVMNIEFSDNIAFKLMDMTKNESIKDDIFNTWFDLKDIMKFRNLEHNWKKLKLSNIKNNKIYYVYQMCCGVHCFLTIHTYNEETDKSKFILIEMPGGVKSSDTKVMILYDENKKFSTYYNDKHTKPNFLTNRDKEILQQTIDSQLSKECDRRNTFNKQLKIKNKTVMNLYNYIKKYLELYPKYSYFASICPQKMMGVGNCQTVTQYLIKELSNKKISAPLFNFKKTYKEHKKELPEKIEINTTKNGGKKKKIRKHKGINQRTGKLKKGYKYTNKKLKNGSYTIIKK